MHKPDVKELGELSHSALLLHEWTAYREFTSEFYPIGATRVVIMVNDDWDSELGNMYAIGSIEVFAGETRLSPDINKLNAHSPTPLFEEEDGPDEFYDFLDDFIADLPIPFTIGDLVKDDTVEVDITQVPEGAKMAQRIWLED